MDFLIINIVLKTIFLFQYVLLILLVVNTLPITLSMIRIYDHNFFGYANSVFPVSFLLFTNQNWWMVLRT